MLRVTVFGVRFHFRPLLVCRYPFRARAPFMHWVFCLKIFYPFLAHPGLPSKLLPTLRDHTWANATYYDGSNTCGKDRRSVKGNFKDESNCVAVHETPSPQNSNSADARPVRERRGSMVLLFTCINGMPFVTRCDVSGCGFVAPSACRLPERANDYIRRNESEVSGDPCVSLEKLYDDAHPSLQSARVKCADTFFKVNSVAGETSTSKEEDEKIEGLTQVWAGPWAKQIQGDTLTLNWTPPNGSSRVLGYKMLQSLAGSTAPNTGNSTKNSVAYIGDPNERQILLKGLIPGNTYDFQVQALVAKRGASVGISRVSNGAAASLTSILLSGR